MRVVRVLRCEMAPKMGSFCQIFSPFPILRVSCPIFRQGGLGLPSKHALIWEAV